MDKKDLKEIAKLFKAEAKPIHGEIALLKREIGDSRRGRWGVEAEVRKLAREVARIDSNIAKLSKTVTRIFARTGALIVEVNHLKNLAGALGDKIDANVDTTKRKIAEIREDLGLSA